MATTITIENLGLVIPAIGMERSCRLDIAKTSAKLGYTGHVVFEAPQYGVYDRFCIEDVLSRSRPN